MNSRNGMGKAAVPLLLPNHWRSQDRPPQVQRRGTSLIHQADSG
jgi:hypothetical protein